MNNYGVIDKKIISKGEKSLELEFKISGDSLYFDGHFPEFKLLPAVAQIDIVTSIADEYFAVGAFLKEIKRIKFVSPLLPETLVKLSLVFESEKNLVTFGLSSKDDGRVFCQGSYSI